MKFELLPDQAIKIGDRHSGKEAKSGRSGYAAPMHRADNEELGTVVSSYTVE
jgi:hypothetical protein